MSKSVSELLGLFEFLGLADLTRSSGLEWMAMETADQASALPLHVVLNSGHGCGLVRWLD